MEKNAMQCLPLGVTPSLPTTCGSDMACTTHINLAGDLRSHHSKHTHNMYYTPDNKMSCDIVHKIQQTNKKFKRACQVVVLLNNKLDGLQQRYNRARGDDRRSFRYNIRLRLCTVEGSRNMFYEYASQRADEMEESDGSAN